MTRALDIYAIERRVGQVAYVAPLAVIKAAVWAWYFAGDVADHARRAATRAR